jgi:hypothetical protein
MAIASPLLRWTPTEWFLQTGCQESRGHLIRVRHNGRELASQQDTGRIARNPIASHDGKRCSFTDRALYRPGQTIQYKGIALEVNQDKDNYEVLPRRRITVVFAIQTTRRSRRRSISATTTGRSPAASPRHATG